MLKLNKPKSEKRRNQSLVGLTPGHKKLVTLIPDVDKNDGRPSLTSNAQLAK